MQKVIKGEELLKYIDEAITILSDAVKTTLGPNGNNVIINDSNFSPYITNDGVTIAAAITDENEITNTILTIIKEAALKTDSDVGDGTTTTICLLESIYKNSIQNITSKNDALRLKKELEESTKKVIDMLNKFSKIPSDKELEKIASISANDEKIGKLITKFYLKLNKSNNIKLMENLTDNKDYAISIPGFFIENTIASPYFIKEKELTIKSPITVLYNKDLTDTCELEQIIYDANMENKDLIIMANSFSDTIINDILAINYEQENKIILLNNPEYGTKRLAIIDDLKIITNAKKINTYYIGSIKEFKYTNESITFIYDQNSQLDKYIEKVKQELANEKDEFEQEFLKIRLSKLTNTFGIIYVGGTTKLERREKKMRFTDALCALNAATNGILPGSSLPLYQISEKLEPRNTADVILSNALKEPLIQILKNSNVDYPEILKKIKDNDYQILYNAKNKTFESITDTNVLDSFLVLSSALKNAVSIASLLLTTSHLVINVSHKESPIISSINEEF